MNFSLDRSSPDTNRVGGSGVIHGANTAVHGASTRVSRPSNASNGHTVSGVGTRRDFCVDRFLQNRCRFLLISSLMLCVCLLKKMKHCSEVKGPFL